MANEQLGFIGLGIMGKPMAKHLLKAGYPVTVWNRSQPGIDELVAAGARAAGSPKQVGQQSEVVVTIVGDTPDVEAVVLGQDGIAAGLKPGGVVIDMTTAAPRLARDVATRLRGQGCDFLDAPVSGGERGAVEGTLSIMVGGERDTFERCLPVLQAMGRNIVHVGANGAGQTVKLANQIICVNTILAAAEGLAFASRAGVDLDKMMEAVTQGAAQSWLLENLGPKMIDRDFAPGFFVRHQQKDLRLVQEAAAELNMSLPGASLVQQLFRAVQARGMDEAGTQALICALEELGDFRVGKQSP